MSTPSSIKRADTSFEYFLFIATILHSILYQLITWLLEYPKEGNYAIAFGAVFILPNILALVVWIRVNLDGISRKTIILRIIAWSTAEAGIAVSITLLSVLLSLRLFEISVNLGILCILFGSVILIPFVSITNKILLSYEKSTPKYKLWQPRCGRKVFSIANLMSIFVYSLNLSILAAILWFWTNPLKII